MAALCARLHIKHGITRWEGDKPASGVAAAARATRYRLLAEAAGSAGADIVLTGHTLDDQIETVAMRKLRGEGRGLAGMAPATLFEGRTWIARPLLGLRRERLRDFLRQNEVGWADDPTNVNIKYERPRVRAGLRSGAERGDLLPGIEVAQRRRIDLGKRAAVILRETATLAAPGLLRLDRKFDESADAEAAVYALRILLAASGGFEQLPDEERTAGLFRRLSGGTLRATLSRSVVDARKGGIYLRREARGLPPAMPVADGMVWDGRFRFRIAATTSPMTVAPHGAQNARNLRALRRRRAAKPCPRCTRRRAGVVGGGRMHRTGSRRTRARGGRPCNAGGGALGPLPAVIRSRARPRLGRIAGLRSRSRPAIRGPQ